MSTLQRVVAVQGQEPHPYLIPSNLLDAFRKMEEYLSQSTVQPVSAGVPTLCPKCNGQKKVSKPPWIPGDVNEWSATTTVSHICDVCNGAGVLFTPIANLPSIAECIEKAEDLDSMPFLTEQIVFTLNGLGPSLNSAKHQKIIALAREAVNKNK